ncbi:CvpA family protein [Leeuwenhoekiella sp. W20_SRS_FM14]|uniref:CvpA family protein n=1 Tax=Leeuwenhoekiella sp. W20_SRS_FM14 TaxID=3240270 RepID=UPI002746C353|nr:CvpA family protein [Leeuwenhoekiella sp.]
MNYLDIILGIFLILGLYKGIKNGLLIELASIIALVIGIYGAIHFSYYAVDYLNDKVAWSEHTINLLAFALTFITIVLIISLAGRLLTKVASLIMLGIVNKILGGLFGVLKVAFILSVILMFSSALTMTLIDEKIREESVVYNAIQPIAPLVLPNLLREVDKLKTENPESNEDSQLQLESA